MENILSTHTFLCIFFYLFSGKLDFWRLRCGWCCCYWCCCRVVDAAHTRRSTIRTRRTWWCATTAAAATSLRAFSRARAKSTSRGSRSTTKSANWSSARGPMTDSWSVASARASYFTLIGSRSAGNQSRSVRHNEAQASFWMVLGAYFFFTETELQMRLLIGHQ